MTVAPLFASTLGQIFSPLFELLSWIIAGFYAVIPNYAVAIALLTIVVMVVTAPLTVKSTRSMLAMQKLQPEMKKLQQKYKGDRQTLNDELMKLYKEHNVNPASGCLPMVIQIPVFIILYDVIRGLTNTTTVHGVKVAAPRYISHSTRLYANLTAPGHAGKMQAFGINLADTLFSHHASWTGYLPYGALILGAIALQYLQMRQMSRRNPAAAQANPQMQAMQRYMPLIFAVIYLRIAAGVNVYFIISAACRIGIQEWVFRSGILEKPARSILPGSGSGGAKPRRTLMERLAEAQQRALEQQQAARALQAGGALPPSAQGDGGAAPSGNGSGDGSSKPGGANGRGGASAQPGGTRTGNGAAGSGKTAAPRPPGGAQNRSKSKKTRKAR